MMNNLFPSITPDALEASGELNRIQQGSLFHTIEYELSGIVSKIRNVNNLDEAEIKSIIIRQHNMILNYDLFLISSDTRQDALTLFTSKKFLRCFIDVIRLLDLTLHEITCINKLAYDYYILPDKDKEVSDLLYRLTTEVNGKEVLVLSGIVGMGNAQVLSMIKNSSFKIEKSIHRVNTWIVKCDLDLSVQDIINIYCYLFERFTNPFIYTMLEPIPKYLSIDQYNRFNKISTAIVTILESLPSSDIKKVLCDYHFILTMVKPETPVRFSMREITGFKRVYNVVKELAIVENIIIP